MDRPFSTPHAFIHIATALSQVRNATSDAGAGRSLALLLASRRIDRGMLEHSVSQMQPLVPSKQQLAKAEATGVALDPQWEMARLVVPVLKAQLRNERRWCAWCIE